MGFKVRGYTRDVPQEKVRDYSLFAIATEGSVREPEYFLPFDGIERIKVDIIEPEPAEEDAQLENSGSSPSQVLKRVRDYIDKYQLSSENGDSLWCVIDKDRWPQEQIEELHTFCAQKGNWHLVISNPCIEIWLLYHKMSDLSGLGITEAKDAKRALGEIDGGYYYIKYLPLMLDAIKNASRADSMPEGWMPGLLETKVYYLCRALYERMGKVRFERFVASLPQLDRDVRGKKLREKVI
jgi:hypothetical protein